VTINGLVRWTINRGYAGLEAWAGTPGTVGGAIYGNAHWKKINIGDLVESVRLVKPTARCCRRRRSHGVRVRLQPAEAHRRDRAVGGVSRDARRRSRGAASVARESLAFRKRTQPLESPSAGCIFMNPDPVAIACPRHSAVGGALVDRAGSRAWRWAARGVADARQLHHHDGSAAPRDHHARRAVPRAVKEHSA
jgi:UDP-N-acetylmuramate dehydrogenase